MAKEIDDKIDLLLIDLSKKTENYSFALLADEGYDKRKAIRNEIRAIEAEIKLLREKLKTLE